MPLDGLADRAHLELGHQNFLQRVAISNPHRLADVFLGKPNLPPPLPEWMPPRERLEALRLPLCLDEGGVPLIAG